MSARKILLLNGPNMDMLGVREPGVYGHDTLSTLEHTVRMHTEQRGAELTCYQSNSEGKLIGKIHGSQGKYDGIVYNPGAHTHYSYALRDAIAAIDVPVVEVHLSDIDGREPFRSVSVIAPVCVAQVKGLGVRGYCLAVDVLLDNGGLPAGEKQPRLGEGYEQRFGADVNVRIAGREGAADAGEDAEGCAGEDAGEGAESRSDASEVAKEDLEEDPAAARMEGTGAGVDPVGPFLEAITAVDLGEVSAARLSLVRGACEGLGIDALLVRDTSSIQWASALDGVFDTEQAHALLVAPGVAALHTDSRYSNAVRTAARAIGGGIAVDDSRVGHFKFADSVLAPDGGMFEGRLGFEDAISFAEFTKAKDALPATELVPTSDVVRSLRAVKGPAEIIRLRAAQAITDAAFLHIIGFMRPGMTEREVQLELEGFMLRHGADGLAFGSIVACGENGADPHAVPGGKRLEAGHCVVMDFGARAFGYCSDMTRMVFLGAPQGQMARAWSVLREANETVEAMLCPGVTGREAHETAERVLADGGFEGKMGHGLGHGVGIDCHELPVLNTRNDEPLVQGNVVTVEPGIYLPGQFGMRLEDCGVITADGYEVFSRLGHDTVIL